MKKLGVLLILAFLLTGCSGTPREIEEGMALRSELLKASSCTFDTELTADYGDKLFSFAMSCTGDAQGNVSFTVTQPESIAGITGEISQKSGKLTFDETALQFDLMADDQISPVSAPWVFLKTLRSGYLTSAATEDGRIRLTMDDSYEDEALHLDIWLDQERLPTRAEILYDGRRILSLSIKNFVIS